jgi:hypothetical protein
MSQSSQEPRVTLAESSIGRQDRLLVELVPTEPATIVVTWPSRPTLVSLQQFGNFLSRVFRCLANADVELRHYTARSRTTKIVDKPVEN